jgi:arabinan endo-1,5-alpha-L-arabinosidase
MFMNADGWPVVAPYRYAKEKATAVRREFVVGDYLYINHGKDISAAVKKSQSITLGNDGRITGAVTGTWRLYGTNSVELFVNGAASPYKGVFLNQWNETTQSYAMTLSALSREGVAVFGSRLVPRTDAQVVSAVHAELSLGNTTAVSADLSLPTSATRGAVISWASSNPAVVSNTGVVTPGASDVTLTLSARISKGTASAVKTFTVTVRKAGGLLAHYAFDGNLLDSSGVSAAGTVVGSRIDLAGGSIGYEAGIKGNAAVFNGASGIRLPNGLISTNNYTVALWLKPAQLTAFSTTFFGARTTESWVSLLPMGHGAVNGASMLWSGTAWYDAGLGMNIPVGRWSHLAFTVRNGAVNVYVDGVRRFSGSNFPNVFTTTTGAFALGVNWWDAPYKGSMDELRIYGTALSDADVSALAR